MALFLGAKGSDVLSWRVVANLAEGVRERLAGERATLASCEEVPLLRELKERLEQEIAFEELFAADFSKLLDSVEMEADDLLPLREELARLALDHFERRGSVIAFHELCAGMQRSLVRRSLRIAENWMVQHGFGALPGRYCWVLLGYPGRGEGTVFGDGESLLVYEEKEGYAGPYFPVFARKAEELLLMLGLRGRRMAAHHFSWSGTIAEWRLRLSEGMADQRNHEELAALMEFADILPLHGDERLSADMLNLVRGMLFFHRDHVRAVARHVSEMPTGLDFFGRLRVERSGPHRGFFNLEQYALAPLVGNVRVIAIKCEVRATNTVERIREIMEAGALTVELAERLLLAFHDFTRHKLALEAKQREKGVWLDVAGLDSREEDTLKAGLEALVSLQRIVYQSFTEQM